MCRGCRAETDEDGTGGNGEEGSRGVVDAVFRATRAGAADGSVRKRRVMSSRGHVRLAAMCAS